MTKVGRKADGEPKPKYKALRLTEEQFNNWSETTAQYLRLSLDFDVLNLLEDLYNLMNDKMRPMAGATLTDNDKLLIKTIDKLLKARRI